MLNKDTAAPQGRPALSFDNTAIAFRHFSDTDLKRAYWLFRMISVNLLVRVGPPLTAAAIAIGLPVKKVVKATLFRHFCGGESIEECEATIHNLYEGRVGTILDYSVEGEERESVFEHTKEEILRTIRRAKGDERIPLTVFKPTGVIRFGLMEKLDAGVALTTLEQDEWENARGRVTAICREAFNCGVPVMIDAEESWIQRTIDQLALAMMRQFNRDKVVVYNTYQLYRSDKLASLREDHAHAAKEGFLLGAKLVRGAYMEKERRRSAEKGTDCLIHVDKAATDRDYNEALRFCLAHLERVAFVAGTHNEESCRLLASLIDKNLIGRQDSRVYFSQLLGMSDNLSFNLADAGYNVAKYVPYGPVKAVLPYLFRRAQENTAISGQMGRELGLIIAERKRRRL